METAPALEPTDGPLTFEEVQLAARNRGMGFLVVYRVRTSGALRRLHRWPKEIE